jgi:Amt family ammonium transporter
MLLTAVFASTGLGIFSGQGYTTEGATMGSQLGVQAIAVLATLGYTAIGTFVLLKITGAIVGNRVADDEEIEGLDLVLHNERGYDL